MTEFGATHAVWPRSSSDIPMVAMQSKARIPTSKREIHTEVSCKFTRHGVENDFRAAGRQLDQWLTDGQHRFALAVASHA